MSTFRHASITIEYELVGKKRFAETRSAKHIADLYKYTFRVNFNYRRLTIGTNVQRIYAIVTLSKGCALHVEKRARMARV